MTGLLMTVGIFVFMLTVYGAVMIGGHLLAELQADAETVPEPDEFARDEVRTHSPATVVE
jgi:hypothetical protein